MERKAGKLPKPLPPSSGNGKGEPAELEIGLCRECWYSSMTGNRLGNVFLLCERSREDSSYPKYPRLPVLACKGFVPERKSEPG